MRDCEPMDGILMLAVIVILMLAIACEIKFLFS